MDKFKSVGLGIAIVGVCGAAAWLEISGKPVDGLYVALAFLVIAIAF